MSDPDRFVDTGYWIALVDRSDRYHDRARAFARDFGGPFVTAEAVLTEVGNTLAGQRWRAAVVTLLGRIRANPAIEILPVSAAPFGRAVDLYAARPDKEWDPTDCISFVVMQDHGIAEALAADQHFIQAGFRALLRKP
ncbi:MAG: type II toxin-antitoxin system VapC family toxin [Dehalococcoidia bacterium]